MYLEEINDSQQWNIKILLLVAYVIFFKIVVMSVQKGSKNYIKSEQKQTYIVIKKYDFNKYNWNF